MYRIIHGDARVRLKELDNESVQCVITSPPYWLQRVYESDAETTWGGRSTCEHDWLDAVTREHGGDGMRGYVCWLCGAWKGQLGMEPSPEMYVHHIVSVMEEVKRVLRLDGVVWLNLGDKYFGSGHGRDKREEELLQRLHPKAASNKGAFIARNTLYHVGSHPVLKPKDLCMLPARVAIALQEAGWYIRADIIWHKPNAMPSSVTDRPALDYEHVFLLSKSRRYYFDMDAIREPHLTYDPRSTAARMSEYRGKYMGEVAEQVNSPRARHARSDYEPHDYHPKGRAKRSVWSINTIGFKGAHYATFPPKLIQPMILAGSREGDTVLDPFAGTGTVGVVAEELNRHSILIDACKEYCDIAEQRMTEATAQMRLM